VAEVAKMLYHDEYEEVAKKDLLMGDIILYYGEKGDIEHSGIVVGIPDPEFGIPMIVSKWGKFKEKLHMANQCPYNYNTVRYHRIKK
jgi:hypothetical protein